MARRLGVRSVTVPATGPVRLTMPHGAEKAPQFGGKPVELDADAVRESGSGGRSWKRRYPDLTCYGVEWDFKPSNEGEDLVIVPRKPFPVTLGMLATFDPEQTAKLRSLYSRSDVVIQSEVAGETRAVDLAFVITAERAMIGLPSETSIVHEESYGSPHERLPALDPPSEFVGRPVWTFGLRGLHGMRKGQEVDPTVAISATLSRYSYVGRDIEGLEDDGVPTVRIDIDIVDSKPVGRITFSASAQLLVNPDIAKAPDLPWNMIDAESARRRSRAPARQKTWLPTTAHVGQAFVARKLPRGYVSGKSLYFHGPIAYSESDSNPVAAFVNDKNGSPTLVFGRNGRWNGSAVASMAQGDIGDAARAAGLIDGHHIVATTRPPAEGCIPAVGIGDTRGVLSFAGIPAEKAPRHFRDSKDEDSHPRTATLDPKALGEWLADREASARQEISDAHASGAKYPTKRRAEAFSAMLALDKHIGCINDLYGFSIPRPADIEEIRKDADFAWEAYRRREAALASRKPETTSEPEGARP